MMLVRYYVKWYRDIVEVFRNILTIVDYDSCLSILHALSLVVSLWIWGFVALETRFFDGIEVWWRELVDCFRALRL